MASDTYSKEMWLRRNRTAMQVVMILLSLTFIILIVRWRSGSSSSQDRDHYRGVHQLPSIDVPDTGGKNIRGRIVQDEDFLDIPDDVEKVDVDPECCTVYDLWAPALDDFECFPLDFDPQPVVCVHPDQDQKDVITQVDPDTAELILRHLSKEGVGYIDTAAEVGGYSLAAATLGHPVLAVISQAQQVKLFHKATKLGRLENWVTLLHNDLSDSRQERISGLKSILLDDLPAFAKFRQGVLRLSAQGQEHRIFQQSHFLFRELHISYVFLDWRDVREKTAEDDVTLVDDMLSYFNKRGYVPRSYNGRVLSLKKWSQWPDRIYWEKM